MIRTDKISHILKVIFAFAALSSCRPEVAQNVSRIKWGVHQEARNANLLNLLPGQSVSVCAPNDEWTKNAHDAIKQWGSAIGRWGFFEVKDCDQKSDLRIDIQGFENTGLNYFTSRPGRVFIDASATGRFAKAITLHEFGHSFGMCDQYMDAGNANCSSDRGPRQDTDEIMGATTPQKLKLTAGDIEGVMKAASDMSIRANAKWQSFLTKQSIPEDLVFAQVLESADNQNPKLAVSVNSGSLPIICSNTSTLDACTKGNAQEIQFEKSQPINGRDIYLSKSTIGNLLSSGKMEFVATVSNGSNTHTMKFVIKKK